jgi:hypothetical protein
MKISRARSQRITDDAGNVLKNHSGLANPGLAIGADERLGVGDRH